MMLLAANAAAAISEKSFQQEVIGSVQVPPCLPQEPGLPALPVPGSAERNHAKAPGGPFIHHCFAEVWRNRKPVHWI